MAKQKEPPFRSGLDIQVSVGGDKGDLVEVLRSANKDLRDFYKKWSKEGADIGSAGAYKTYQSLGLEFKKVTREGTLDPSVWAVKMGGRLKTMIFNIRKSMDAIGSETTTATLNKVNKTLAQIKVLEEHIQGVYGTIRGVEDEKGKPSYFTPTGKFKKQYQPLMEQLGFADLPMAQKLKVNLEQKKSDLLYGQALDEDKDRSKKIAAKVASLLKQREAQILNENKEKERLIALEEKSEASNRRAEEKKRDKLIKELNLKARNAQEQIEAEIKTVEEEEVARQKFLAAKIKFGINDARRREAEAIKNKARIERTRREEEKAFTTLPVPYRSPTDLLTYFGSRKDLLGREASMKDIGKLTPEAARGYRMPVLEAEDKLAPYGARLRETFTGLIKEVETYYERIEEAGIHVSRGTVVTGIERVEKLKKMMADLTQVLPEEYFKIDPETGKRTEELTLSAKLLFRQLGIGQEVIGGVDTKLESMQKTLEEVNIRTGFWATNLKAVMRWALRIFGVYAIFKLVTQSIKKVITNALEWNTAMKQTEAITLRTGLAYGQLGTKLAYLSVKYGQLAVTQLKAVKPLIQMRLTAEEIGQILPKALMFSNVYGEDLGETINYLTSAMAHYNLTAKESADLLEDWSVLQSNYAVDAGLIAKGFMQMGATAKDMGLDVKYLNAILAVMEQKTRGGMAGMERYLKLTAEALFEKETAMAIYKWAGVVTVTEEGARDLSDVLDELGEKWKNLTDKERDSIVVSMTNKSSREAFRSLMDSMPKVQEAYNLQLSNTNDLEAKNNIVMQDVTKQLARIKGLFLDIIAIPVKGFFNAIGVASDEFLERLEDGLTRIHRKLKDLKEEDAKSKIGEFSLYGMARKVLWGPVLEPLLFGKKTEKLTPEMMAMGMMRARRDISEGALAPGGQEGDKGIITVTVGGPAQGEAIKNVSEVLSKLMALNKSYTGDTRVLNSVIDNQNNLLDINNEEYKLSMGYTVGIRKRLMEETLQRRELANAIQNSTDKLKLLREQRDKYEKQFAIREKEYAEKGISVPSAEEERDPNIIESREKYEAITKDISKEELALIKTNVQLKQMDTVLRDIANTFRTDINGALSDILTQSDDWLDVNMKIQNAIAGIGKKLIDTSLDYITSPLIKSLTAPAPTGETTGPFGSYGASMAQSESAMKLALMKYAGAGMMGVSMGQSRGTAGMIGGGIGSMLGLAVAGPIGAMIGGTLGSLFGEPKKEDKIEDVQESITDIPTKLDITNDQLQIVNRNLMALREKWDPYPLRECLADDSDILTNKGWRNVDTIKNSDLVATWDYKNNKVLFSPIDRLIIEDYEGEMFEYDRKGSSFCVTPNHSFIYRTANNNWQFSAIKDLEDYRMITVKKDSYKIKGELTTYFNIGRFKLDMKLWLQFLGWFISEGWTTYQKANHSKKIHICNGKYADEIEDLLIKLNFKFSRTKHDKGENIYKLNIFEAKIHDFLTKECGANSHNKKIPDFIRGLDSSLISIFIDAFQKGDGSKLKDGREFFYSVSKQLIGEIQELLFRLGKSSHIYTEIRDTNYKKNALCYILYVKKYTMTSINPKYIKKIKYKGKIFDVTVNPFHTIYIRRNGKCMWSGNSAYFKQRPGTGLSVQNMNIYIPEGMDAEEMVRYLENTIGLQSKMYYVGNA